MNEWIQQVLTSEHATPLVLVAAFVMGMISVVTCGCNFAIIGAVAGYSGASANENRPGKIIFKGVAFLVGGIISMAVIGALFGYAGQWINNSFGSYWKIVAGLVMIFFGLYSMDFLPFKLPSVTLKQDQQESGFFSAILFGLMVGGLSAALNSCCNPLFPVILAASFVKGSAFWGLTLLTTFAAGYGLPLATMLIGLSLGFGKVSKTMTIVGNVVKYIGGGSLVAFGFYFLITI